MQPDRKAEILDAAGCCFSQYGYEKTTMDDIGKLVGMNKVSLYYYFASKEALFKEMLGREAAAFRERTSESLQKVEGCRERIRAWVQLSFRYGQTSGVLRMLSVEALRGLSPLLREYRELALEASERELAAFLEEGAARGEIGRCDAGAVARSIVRVAFALKDAAYKELASSSGGEVDAEALAREILAPVDLILEGLESSAARRGKNALEGVKGLSDAAIQAWLAKVGAERAGDLEIALLGAGAEVRERVMRNMSKRAVARLGEDIRSLEARVAAIESMI